MPRVSHIPRLLACFLLALLAVHAAAQARRQLPALIQKDLAEMARMCKEAGGRPGRSPELLTVVDLTGDGVADFVVDQGAFNCEGAASLFGGSGGSQVAAYVGRPDGQAVAAFASGSFGMRIDKAARPARLELQVGGPLCGQKVTPRMARAEYRGCWRPVLWNARTGKLDFAPVSQVKPVQ